jgi:pimeloyl-ACP methyl ester carboxylesterase
LRDLSGNSDGRHRVLTNAVIRPRYPKDAAVTDWRTGYAANQGERIYWECAGEGIPIVLCHGAGSNHISLYQQMAGMASDRHQVVVWDQRGYGNSTLTTGIFGIGTAGTDLTTVLEAVGLADARIHLVGQALGGMVAAAWAVANPGRSITLALCDGPLALTDEGRRVGWSLEPRDEGVEATLVDREVGRTPAVGLAFQEADRVGTYLYQTLQELGNVKPTYADVFAAAQAEPVPVAGLIALDIPILLMRGEHDHVADDAAYRSLAARLPRATMVTIPGGGHSPYFETPEEWNGIILRHVGAETGGHAIGEMLRETD